MGWPHVGYVVVFAADEAGDSMNVMLLYWAARRVKSELVVTLLASELMLTMPYPPKAGK